MADLFEKYYRLSHTNEEIIFPPTYKEITWLKYMLKQEEAKIFLEESTISKINNKLNNVDDYILPEHVILKGLPKVKPVDKTIYRLLSKAIRNRNRLELKYRNRNKEEFSGLGIPYKLEFFYPRGEWYLLWYRETGDYAPFIMRTPLNLISGVVLLKCSEDEFLQNVIVLENKLEQRRLKMVIKIPAGLTTENIRLFNSFSFLDTHVFWHEDTEEFYLETYYYDEEEVYILAKLREWGTRVILIEPKGLKEKLQHSLTQAINRYNDNFEIEV
ncbi:hypothetical protein SYNTR_1191 [Candidatus Syntrophocurvum alkaliphilum]|uniref:WYL domain-containing protein n=1 Tax=Candidatus Syntrophocurvum alkaliphilum TaxID=2293317 RepID=A0A6I6DIW9_9FIRM|nr:WYL domain-containing protein [Candidatus Syntrophocurvum alkaliphilum]QGT99784.1 hypothetical protein SYNTR_1191 [Candidatus Syntrophocurvum alkaliphilum]